MRCMNNVKVSILIPAYNVELYIEECLDSVVSQTLKNIEIIIVDDASTDQTVSILERYATIDSRVHLIKLPEHQGVSNARNICLKQATGEFLSFVDSDDTITSTAMEELYEKAVMNKADIVLGSILCCFQDKRQMRVGEKTSCFYFENEILSGKECFTRMYKTGSYVPMVCGNLYRTEFIKKNIELHFEGFYHEDEYFTPYALYYAKRVTYLDRDFYFYRQRPDSIMHRNDNLKQRAESLSYISENIYIFLHKQERFIDFKLKRIYKLHAERLKLRAQLLYEKELSSSKKKCILIFNRTSTAYLYGIGTYLNLLVKCFNPNEWDINVITTHASNVNDIAFMLKDGVAWYEFSYFSNKSLNQTTNECFYYQSIFYYLMAHMDVNRRLICHFNYFSHCELAYVFKNRLQVPVVSTLHYTNWSFELLGNIKVLPYYLESKNSSIKREFDKERSFLNECCDHIIAIAKHSFKMMREIYNIPSYKISYIPNGVKNESLAFKRRDIYNLRKKYQFSENDKIIIFAGRLNPVKGIFELLEVFKEIVKIIPEVKLIVAGDGDFSKIMQAALPYINKISFVGFVPQNKLYELYSISDLGVVPSYHEEFGYVAIEMMLNYLPVVVHNTTGLKEIVNNGEYAYTFKYNYRTNSLKSLYNAIVKALQENKDLSELIEIRNNLLKKYSISIFCDNILSLYNSIKI